MKNNKIQDESHIDQLCVIQAHIFKKWVKAKKGGYKDFLSRALDFVATEIDRLRKELIIP